jgi:hypothetical protein
MQSIDLFSFYDRDATVFSIVSRQLLALGGQLSTVSILWDWW